MSELVPISLRKQEHPALKWVALGFPLVGLIIASTPQGLALSFAALLFTLYRLKNSVEREE
jgi:hypothetical protein